ncbi:MAG: secretin and TonB N-terminal domain-containing protein [Kiritimatiellae bacterium]|nr:secretin and TonB N-terminal domain-containing protein [Kiritimatiellia bacterium]
MRCRWSGLLGGVALLLGRGWEPAASQAPATAAPPAAVIPPSIETDLVTLNIQDADIQQVLEAFRRQTGRNIVIGPEVRGTVNVRVDNLAWDRALDVILRPYGFTYELADGVIIVTKADPSKAASAAAEPVLVKVFQLKYLDASDLEDVIRPHLSSGGSMVVLRPLGQYWEPETASGGGSRGAGSGPDTALARGRRTLESKAVVRSKRFIVRDTAAVLKVVEQLVEQLDVPSPQVLIEARFVEVSSDAARDLGIQLDVERVFLNGRNVQRVLGESLTLDARPRVLPTDAPFTAMRPFTTGGQLFFQQLTDVQYSILLHALEDILGANVLSSPRIVTLNNQEARILVGEKFPILTYQNTPVGGGSVQTQVTLEYYEKIGIQLAVVPQICDGGRISMIVRPSVSDRISLVETYPVLSTREAETQIMLRSGETIVIGGLVRERERSETFRVPLLGEIPLLGALFRRETKVKDKVDLLIFLTATILEPGAATATPAP